MNVTLYKKDSAGRLRVWEIKVENHSYFTRDYIKGGKIKEWTETKCYGKNIGRSNATTDQAQATMEASNIVAKKLKEKYFYTEEDAMADEEFRPMLATEYDKSKPVKDLGESFEIFSQPKLDGIRNNTMKKGNALVNQSRNGRPIVSCPHILEALKNLPDNIILDGELYNHQYHERFEELVSIIRQSKCSVEDLKLSKEVVQYHLYDLYDKDNPNLSNAGRLQLLNKLMSSFDAKYIKLVPTTTVCTAKEMKDVQSQYLIDGYEGQMLRFRDNPYEVNKRSTKLVKVKLFIDEEFVVLDIHAGKGAWENAAKKVSVNVNGKSVLCGLAGTIEDNTKILANKKDYIGSVATVKHFGHTTAGSLRMPTIKDLKRI